MKPIRTLIVAGALALLAAGAHAQTLRIAMTTSDVPTTGGIPDNGSEGGRFAGYTIYDALVNWDFTKTDAPADLTPGLATEWHVDPNDSKRWIFTLRQGVHFHDGSLLTADDVIWNLDRHLNKDAPQYDTASASYATYTSQIASYEKISDSQIALTTKVPFSMLPYPISRVFIVSPRQYEKVGRDWIAFQAHPAGTGPFKVVSVTRQTSIELERNEDYWDKTRIPKLEKLILLPIPDANTRVAALRSGQVDWIEFPMPDSIPSLQAAGFQIVTKPYLHIWSWRFNMKEEGPLQDVRVRRALNYAIDREGMVALLSGTAVPAIGIYQKENKYFGKPTQIYTYDPEKAKALLAEAGYGPDKRPLSFKVLLPTAGSGNMVPLPMAEFIQQMLAEVGVKVEYEVADWGTVLQGMRTPPGAEGVPHRDAINHGQPFGDPTNLYSNVTSMGGTSNWGRYKNEKVDKLMAEAFASFSPEVQDAKIAEAHALVVDDAPRLFIVHDLNPRALAPNVKGFVQAQSWYQDFTQVTVE
ncbi:ABC transporter substrate-binding protein [Propylenella binzhouense]|uniref:ABC transporter substrate-binding protein n=1 Tax=Propylenella binzhouense TaxID=2555902 RepID=A0A964T655_9HYPH|nr:ABC transporter substrate-binding protein [Propylenella binzhouense]MYZ48617.1 ABC transporter substrate-binding protein [Propylenella binzhouense]